MSRQSKVAAMQKAASTRLADDIQYALQNINTEFPTVKQDVFNEMIPKRPKTSKDWSQADEDRISWSQDPPQLQEALLASTNTKPALWKTCAKYMKCLPTDIIGPKTNLEVDISNNEVLTGLPGKQKAPHWPDRLCKEMQKVIPHPMFQGKPRNLAMTLQYTVICCTNDLRPWDLENTSGDGFLASFLDSMERKEDAQTCVETHRLARERFKNNFPDGSPGFWSELFLSIETEAAKLPKPATEPEEGPYKVTHTNIRVLIAALDGMTYGAITIFRPTEEISQIFQMARNSDDVPTNTPGGSLENAHRDAILDQRRWQIQQHRKNAGDIEDDVEEDTNHRRPAGPHTRQDTQEGDSHPRQRRHLSGNSNRSPQEPSRLDLPRRRDQSRQEIPSSVGTHTDFETSQTNVLPGTPPRGRQGARERVSTPFRNSTASIPDTPDATDMVDDNRRTTTPSRGTEARKRKRSLSQRQPWPF